MLLSWKPNITSQLFTSRAAQMGEGGWRLGDRQGGGEKEENKTRKTRSETTVCHDAEKYR